MRFHSDAVAAVRHLAVDSMSPSPSPRKGSPGASPEKGDNKLAPPGGTRSTLGPQAARESAPMYGFGTSTRANREKVFVSHEHSLLADSETRSPGPATYEQRPSIGPQVNGALESSPLYGFGKSDRDTAAKVYISKEHEKFSGGRNSVGPIYEDQPGIGKQVSSRMTTMPKYGFGSSTRADQSKVYISADHDKLSGGRDAPGPEYNLKPAIGKQPQSFGPTGYNRHLKNASPPTWVLGKAERFDADKQRDEPGPGQYKITAAVGVQVSSRKASLPRYGFGSGTRDQAAKVFISHEHGKVTGNLDRGMPGPGQYKVGAMTGAKVVSSGYGKSSAAWGMGTSKRFADAFAKERAPGPGHYVI